jgi:hypothetical protein
MAGLAFCPARLVLVGVDVAEVGVRDAKTTGDVQSSEPRFSFERVNGLTFLIEFGFQPSLFSILHVIIVLWDFWPGETLSGRWRGLMLCQSLARVDGPRNRGPRETIPFLHPTFGYRLGLLLARTREGCESPPGCYADSICTSSACASASQASPREPHGARRRL